MGPTVSVRVAKVILLAAHTRGGDPDAIAREAGIDVASLGDADARIPLSAEDALWSAAARATGDEAFGLWVAEQLRPGAFDVLDYATRSSANVRTALAGLIRYNRLMHDAAIFSLEPEAPGLVRIAHAYRGVPGGAGRHAVELAFGGLLVVARQCTEVDVVPVEVRFRHTAPADLSRHERIFRTRPRFGEGADALVVEERVLDLPFARPDPGLAAVLERHADALLAALPPVESSLADRVRALVAAELRGGDPAVGALATKLKMSERTLQRKLASEGTSFDALVDGLREGLARRYLADEHLGIAEVAFLLGYSDPSAFHRAFKRWTGTTPGELREHVSSSTRTLTRTRPPRTDRTRRKG